jgi:hypothetical protein
MANEFVIKNGFHSKGDSNVTGSLNVTGTGSFGHFTGDGSGLTGVTGEWDGTHTGDASITGSLTVNGNTTANSGSYDYITLQSDGTHAPRMYFSGSNSSPIYLEVESDGTVAFKSDNSGSLWRISDNLSGSLFQIAPSSGLPILEVFSSERVVAGEYGKETLDVRGTDLYLGANDFSGSNFIRGNVEITGSVTVSENLTAVSISGDGSGLTNIAAAVEANIAESIFVSPDGNDSTAVTGSILSPFATLASASQAAVTGSTIFVYPGTYTAPAENLAFEGGSYYFHPNTVVSKSDAGYVFNSSAFSNSFNVYGHADFHLTASCEGVINAYLVPSLDFECRDITQDTVDTNDYTIATTVNNGNSTTDIATTNIKFRKLKTNGNGIALPGPYTTTKGNYIINCNEIYAGVNGIYSYQGVTYLEINAVRVVANGGAGIRTYYGSQTNINVAYLYGSTYGFDSVGPGFININSSYVSKINNGSSIITLNGHCAGLDTSGGTLVGGSFEGTGTWSGGSNNIILTPTSTEFLVITGGAHVIHTGNTSAYHPSISIQGGLTYIDGYQSSNNSNYNYNISGGELIWKGHTKFSTADNGQNAPFTLTGGVLRIRGHVENALYTGSGVPDYNCVQYSGGTLILEGATLITSSSIAPTVKVIGMDREVKIYSGGVTTNKTGSMGLLEASSSFGSGGYALTNPLGGMIIADASVE